MPTKRSYNNAILNEQDTDPKIVPYNYKKRLEELNKLVKYQVEKQKQNLTQKNTAIYS